MKRDRKKDGYIALMSAVVIAVLLTVVVFVVSFQGFLTRMIVLDSEAKEIANYLAEACVAAAILKIAENSKYPGGETIAVGKKQCYIRLIKEEGSQKIVEVQASSSVSANDYSYVNLRIVLEINSEQLKVVSWQELAEFRPL